MLPMYLCAKLHGIAENKTGIHKWNCVIKPIQINFYVLVSPRLWFTEMDILPHYVEIYHVPIRG